MIALLGECASGKSTVEKELCEKYFITVAQLKYRINKYDWKKSKKKILPKVSNNVIESKEVRIDVLRTLDRTVM